MRFPHGPGGFGNVGGIFADILAGLVFIICFIVVVGLLFVLVRFLLVATKAAELYVAKNSPAAPAVAAAPATPATAVGSTTTTTTPIAKAPATTRTRTTKTPPTT
jgi:cytoskeletal protein RodZ